VVISEKKQSKNRVIFDKNCNVSCVHKRLFERTLTNKNTLEFPTLEITQIDNTFSYSKTSGTRDHKSRPETHCRMLPPGEINGVTPIECHPSFVQYVTII